jgi:hypothetical protein
VKLYSERRRTNPITTTERGALECPFEAGISPDDVTRRRCEAQSSEERNTCTQNHEKRKNTYIKTRNPLSIHCCAWFRTAGRNGWRNNQQSIAGLRFCRKFLTGVYKTTYAEPSYYPFSSSLLLFIYLYSLHPPPSFLSQSFTFTLPSFPHFAVLHPAHFHQPTTRREKLLVASLNVHSYRYCGSVSHAGCSLTGQPASHHRTYPTLHSGLQFTATHVLLAAVSLTANLSKPTGNYIYHVLQHSTILLLTYELYLTVLYDSQNKGRLTPNPKSSHWSSFGYGLSALRPEVNSLILLKRVSSSKGWSSFTSDEISLLPQLAI